METVNMEPEMMHFVDTVLGIDINPPVSGQLALELMVNPPKPGDPSYDTYTQETSCIQEALSQNAQRAWHLLNVLPGMSCQPAMGGIHLYPRLHLASEFLEEAKMLEVEPDVLYCRQLLEEEGVFVGPGCQNGRNLHIRFCVLVPPDTLEEVLSRRTSFHRRLAERFHL